jgi:CheY-like chemotaxis protein
MASTSETSEKKHPPRRRVLIADDNHDTADSLGKLLALWGYEVRVTYDGLAALEAAQTYHPEVALLDLGLPGLDGYQVAQRLRQQPAATSMILIAVTGHQWKDAPRRSQEYGFDHHLVKPIDPELLKDLLGARKARHAGDNTGNAATDG